MESEMTRRHTVETLTAAMLRRLGVHLGDPNIRETPKRYVKMMKEFTYGLTEEGQQEVKDILSKVFPSKNDEMIILKDIIVYALCPHHLLLVRLNVSIGYIPKGKVLGLSKLARLAHLLAKKLVLQEDLTTEIAETLQKELEPLGVMVVIKGEHSCIQARGIEKRESKAITSAITGVFKEPTARAKEEFLELCKR